MIHNKKGGYTLAFNIVYWIPRMILIIIIATTVVSMIRSFLFFTIDVSETEGYVLTNRIVFSPDCLAYIDLTGRVHLGYVDINKFNKDSIEACLYFGEQNDYAAARLTLNYMDGSSVEVMYNPIGFDILAPRAGVDGPGSADYFASTYYVHVIGDEKQPAVLSIELVTPNV